MNGTSVDHVMGQGVDEDGDASSIFGAEQKPAELSDSQITALVVFYGVLVRSALTSILEKAKGALASQGVTVSAEVEETIVSGGSRKLAMEDALVATSELTPTVAPDEERARELVRSVIGSLLGGDRGAYEELRAFAEARE